MLSYSNGLKLNYVLVLRMLRGLCLISSNSSQLYSLEVNRAAATALVTSSVSYFSTAQHAVAQVASLRLPLRDVLRRLDPALLMMSHFSRSSWIASEKGHVRV
jgi:hypothetical protein